MMLPLAQSVDQTAAFRENGREVTTRNSETLEYERAGQQEIVIEVVTEPAEFELLRQEWENLTRSVKYPFMQFEWFASCVEAFCSSADLYVVVLRCRKEICAIAPLVMTAESGGKKLEMLGSAMLFEPVGLIYKNDEFLKLLIDRLFAERIPFLSGRVAADSRESSYFRAKKRTFPFLQFHKSIPSPWLSVQSSWKEYEQRISSSRRSALRRAERRAKEYGTVTQEILSPDAEQAHRSLEEIFDVEHASWKGPAGTSIRSNPELEKFFTHYAATMASAGFLRLCFLRINGKAVAAQIALEYADRFWVLKVGYDEQFANCSPGILLMHRTIQYAFERKLKAYEFMGGDEAWIHMWTDALHDYIFYWSYPLTLSGVHSFIKDGGRIVIQKLHHYMGKRSYDRKN